MENKLEETVVALKQVADKIKGVEREFGSFKARIDDNLDLLIDSEIGWKIVYPFGTVTWAVLSSWIETWDEQAKTSIENFIKGLVFPTSARLVDIDMEYIEDILSAHERLNNRVLDALGTEEDNGESNEEDATLGEALEKTFGEGEEKGDE